MLNQCGVDAVFQALAEPTRRAIVEQLSGGPCSVSEIAAPLPVTLAAVVQHLQVLEASGLVTSQKTGRVRTCQIAPQGFELAERWIRDRKGAWERRLDRLGQMFAEEPKPRRRRKKS